MLATMRCPSPPINPRWLVVNANHPHKSGGGGGEGVLQSPPQELEEAAGPSGHL